MKRSLLTLTMLALIALTFSSCTGLQQVSDVQTASFAPTFVRVDANINDYVQIGEKTISIENKKYLGFNNSIYKVNDEYYNSRDVKIVELEGRSNIKLKGDITKALYKAVEEYPNADYYVPVMKTTEVERMFLGKFTKESVKIKAYMLKSSEK